MARINKEYEHGYRMGYEYYNEYRGTAEDAKAEIARRFNKKAIYSSYGHGFIAGYLDHSNGREQKYERD